MIDELVRHVRRTIPKTCHDTKLSKNGCQIALTGIDANRVIVDMDCNDLGIAKDQSRCDYIFIGEGNWIVPMEMKRGNIQADEVTKQLRAGAAFAERIVPPETDISFRPVVAYGGKLHRSQSEALKRKGSKIRFQNKMYEVKPIRCKAPLARVLC